jgi:hypothetical protein
MKEEGSKGFFFEKKKQKTFAQGGMWPCRRQRPQEQSFFASFCSQKRSAFFTQTNFNRLLGGPPEFGQAREPI